MVTLHDLRGHLVEDSGSIAARMRERRWGLLGRAFPDIASMNVLDLGGRSTSWERAPIRPGHVHLVNMEDPPIDAPRWISAERADACEVGDRFTPRQFDLVFSNSLLEHVGGHYRRSQLADVIRRSGSSYWVQTPYRYFPVEPHFLFPGFQHLPVPARSRIARRWKLMHSPSSDPRTALSTVLSTELVSRTEMRHYFPDATVIGERIAGLTKSLIAVRVA